MRALISIIRLIQLVVFVRILLTWFMRGPFPKGIRPVTDFIDKVLKKFQILFPMGQAYIDIGPILFFLLLEAIQQVLWAFASHGAVY